MMSFSLDAIGDHFQWRLDWDGPVMSYEWANFEDIRPGLHYVREGPLMKTMRW